MASERAGRLDAYPIVPASHRVWRRGARMMKSRLLFACGFCSLCASLPLHAADGPTQQNANPLSERVAALVHSSAEQDAPPSDGGEAGTAPKAPKKTDDAAASKASG